MEQALLISNIVLWLVVVVLASLVLALVRQVGVLHERVAPVGALALGSGPKVGERAPQLELETISGEPLTVGAPNAARSQLLFFLSPTCPVCESLIPVLRAMRISEKDWLDVLLASDGDMDAHLRFVAEKKLSDFPYISSTELGMAFQIGRLPYAVLIDADGVVRGQGLTNTREHIESLFEAMGRGVASIQDWMERDKRDIARSIGAGS